MFKNFKYFNGLVAVFISYCIVAGAIIIMVRNHSVNQLNAELNRVQAHISKAVDIRSTQLEKWVNTKMRAVEDVSNNLTVKMYINSRADKKADKSDLMAQAQFTTAYLESVADEAGFVPEKAGRQVKASVKQNSTAALMIVSDSFQPLISVHYSDNLAAVVGEVRNLAAVEDVSFIRAGDASYIRLVQKIRNLQSDDIIGYAVAVKKLGGDFYEMLDFPPSAMESSATKLFTKNLTTLQPITDGRAAPIVMMEDTRQLGEFYAILSPDVITDKKDMTGERRFITARKMPFADAYLVHSVSYKEAISDSMKNARNLRLIAYIAVALIGFALALVWKYSSSKKYQKLFIEAKSRQRLLSLITENQVQSMFLLDGDSKIAFSNKVFERLNGIDVEADYVGRDATAVLGVAGSDNYQALAEKAHEAGAPLTMLGVTAMSGKKKYLQQKVIPIKNSEFNGTLVIENDITGIIAERMRYEDNLSKSIEILVRIIENRSPYFYKHGKQVHDISMKIADKLGVSENFRKATDIAARIGNLSLALLPREIINKQGQLTEKEKQLFNETPHDTIKIIQDLDFDSPVVETLEQLGEHVDGSGKKGLMGGEILISARIIKAANDFVAMTSERPHRKALSRETAIEALLKDTDTKYSREVIFALANIVSEN